MLVLCISDLIDKWRRTWIGNADSDVSSLELLSGEGNSLDQTITGTKLGITETLWLHVHLVLNNADVDAVASGEEVLDILLGGVEGKVTEMSGVWWLIWKRELLADGVT